MSQKQRVKFSEWSRPQLKLAMNQFISPMPCSLLSDSHEDSSDTPIKLIMNRERSSKGKRSPGTTESCHKLGKQSLKDLDTAQRSNSSLSYDRLFDQNCRLKAELQRVQLLLQKQTIEAQQFSRKLRLKNLEEELNRMQSSTNQTSKLTREVHTLKVANHDLLIKNDELTRSLTSCRQIIAETEGKLHKKKELIKSKDEQLRRYVSLVDELRIDSKPAPSKEAAVVGTFKKHQREQSNQRLMQNSNGQLNRNESTLADSKQLTSRQASKPALKNLVPSGQLSRLWSGTIAKTTRNASQK